MTNPTLTKVAEIAAGLTEAQRRAVLEEYPTAGNWRFSPRGHPATHFALIDRGVLEGVTGLQGVAKARFTPLGLAVRAHLESQP